MRGFIKKSILFLLMIPVIWVIGVYFYGKIMPAFLQRNVRATYYRNATCYAFKELDTLKHADILVAGPSSAVHTFNPETFRKYNTDIFTMASYAQSPVQTEYLVSKYIDQVKPKLFIYTVHMLSIASDGVEGWLFLINNMDKYDSRFIKESVSTRNYYVYNALVYNTINNKISKPKPYISHLEHYIGNGYAEYYSLSNDTAFYPIQFGINRCVMPDIQKEAFAKMMKELKDRNIPVVIIQMPVYKPLFQSFTNAKEIDDYFSSFPGVHYINFNYADFGKYEFWNPNHMNKNGAVKLVSMLIDSLQQMKCFPGTM